MRPVRFLLLFFSALACIFSFPIVIQGKTLPTSGLFAWTCYVPLFTALQGCSPKRQFFYSFIVGFLFCIGSMFWLYTAMNSFGHLSPIVSVLALLLLACILGTYFGLIFFTSAFLEKKTTIARFWLLPLVWVVFEWFRNYVPFNGFPWGQIGYSQVDLPKIAQLSDVTGVYGLTALVVWINLGALEFIDFLYQRSKTQFLRALVAAVFLGATLVYSYFSIQGIQTDMGLAPSFKVALVQGNIPQSDKWLTEKADEIIAIYRKLTEQAFSKPVDLVIWPEASYPYEIKFEEIRTGDVSEIIGRPIQDLIFGALTELPLSQNGPEKVLFEGLTPTNEIRNYRNTMLLVETGGTLKGLYHKQHLVPYGEYVPLGQYFPFLQKMTGSLPDLVPGQRFDLLKSKGSQIGSLICYEDIFPEIARGHSQAGANLLMNPSNDAWYGDSSALPQHLNFSVMRAIENRRFLIRPTNTGITAIIDPLGQIIQTIPNFQPGVLVGEVKLLSHQSLYTRYGDWFPKTCLVMISFLMMISFLIGRNRYLLTT